MKAMTREVKGHRILERISSVRGSEIYKALTPDGEHVVAIRLFHAGLSQNRQLMHTFRDKLRIIANMSHRNIPAIHGSGLLNGRPYIITEYPASGTLQDRFQSGTLAFLDIIEVFREIAAALSSAHSHGIIHGDLQPCDIGFDEDGHVLLSGFGEAQVLDLLQMEEATRAYSEDQFHAPEVVNAGKRSCASDQYTFAAIMLKAIQGPAAGETSDVVSARYGNQVKDEQHPRSSAISLPRGVLEVLQKAMTVDPDDRFTSIAAFEHAFLLAWGRERQSVIARGNSTSQPPTTQRRNPRRFLAYLATTLAIALLFIFTIPALSAAWKGDDQGRFQVNDTSQTIPEGIKNDQQTQVPAEDAGILQTKPGLIHTAEPTPDTSQAWIAIHEAAPSPTSTKLALPTEQPAASPTAMPLQPTSTQPPTDTPPTDTPSTDTPPTNTPQPTAEPEPTPTEDSSSHKCSSSPKHPHYCTPTPEG
jgi:serine/threonine protein kinase